VTRREVPSWVAPLGVAVALTALVGWSFAQRWSVLASSPFPLGVDGYFYPIQLRSLLETGHLQYPASPLAFYLLAPFAAVTDPITGAKLGAAVLGALIAVPAYGVGMELRRDRGAGLVAAALATSSAGSMYLTIEFVKNGIGLTVAMTALWLVLRAMRAPSRRTAGLAIAAIVLALLTHKMAAGLVLGIAIPAAIAEAFRRGKLRWRRILPIAIGLGLLVLAGLAMPERFLSPGDLELIDGLFTTDADWSLPVRAGRLHLGYEPIVCAALAIAAALVLILEQPDRRSRLLLLAIVLQTAGELIGLGTLIVSGGLLTWIVAAGGVALALGGMLLRRRIARTPGPFTTREGAGREVVAWSMIALGALIALPWLDTTDGQGLAMRLRVIAFVPMAFCGSIVASAILRRLEAPRTLLAAALSLGIVMLHIGGTRTEGRSPVHPALVAAAQVVEIPDGGVAIVPSRQVAFMIAWYARTPISLRPEPIAEERRYRVLTLNFLGLGSQLDAALLDARADPTSGVVGVHPLHPNGLVIVPEQTWRAIVARITGVERIRLDVWPTI
jgi:hypothetical protein